LCPRRVGSRCGGRRQHVLKLDHLAAEKESARFRGPQSARSSSRCRGRSGRVATPSVTAAHGGDGVVVPAGGRGIRGARGRAGEPLGSATGNMVDDVGPTIARAHPPAGGRWRGHLEMCKGERLAMRRRPQGFGARRRGRESWEVWTAPVSKRWCSGRAGHKSHQRVARRSRRRRQPALRQSTRSVLRRVRCSCGAEQRPGERCSTCHEIAARVPTMERARVKFGIQLAEPVPSLVAR